MLASAFADAFPRLAARARRYKKKTPETPHVEVVPTAHLPTAQDVVPESFFSSSSGPRDRGQVAEAPPEVATPATSLLDQLRHHQKKSSFAGVTFVSPR